MLLPWTYIAAGRLLETTSLYEIRLVYSGSQRIALQIRHEHLQQLRDASGNPLCQLTAVFDRRSPQLWTIVHNFVRSLPLHFLHYAATH